MTAMQLANFVMDYVTPVGLTMMFILMIYLFATEAVIQHRRLRRQRKQQIH